MGLAAIYTVESWPLSKLRPHPENGVIFGDPEESKEFDEICASIKAIGVSEPLIVKADGKILSGHLRFACAEKLKMKSVPVRVWPEFASYLDEVKFLIRSNTDRRQMTPVQIAHAFRRLKEIPREQGGAKKKRGGDHGNQHCGEKRQGAESRTLPSTTRDEAAAKLGVSRDIAEACETVFHTPGVPEVLKAAVNDGKVAPTTAAKEVRAEVKRQGGAIKTATALTALAERKPTPPSDEKTDHARRVESNVKEHQKDFAELLGAYRVVDRVLTRRPLKTILGPDQHHEWASLCRDVAMRAWREIESVEGSTNAGKQMALTVITGGKS